MTGQLINEQLFSMGENIWNTLTLEFIFKFIIVYFFIVWIALIVWVIKDISIRSNSRIFQLISILTVTIGTPFGVFIYLLIRPRRTLYDKYYEEIEDNLEIINELVEERKKQIEDSFKRQKIPRKMDSVKKIELVQKETLAKITDIGPNDKMSD